MKALPLVLLGGAGAALAFIAWRAPAPNYVAPTSAELLAHAPAPQDLVGEVPAGCVVRTFEVQGMCCTGCTGKLYDRLKTAPGVVNAAVNFEKGVAEVVLAKDADVVPIETAMHFDKYVAKLRE